MQKRTHRESRAEREMFEELEESRRLASKARSRRESEEARRREAERIESRNSLMAQQNLSSVSPSELIARLHFE